MDSGDLSLVISVIAIVLMLVGWLVLWLLNRRRKIYRHFKVITKSHSLLAQDLLDDRYDYFNPYYLKRTEDDKIKSLLEAGKNVLVVGEPLAGKTRAVFEAIKSLKRKHHVAVVKNSDIDQNEIVFPWWINRTLAAPTIIIIDDLQTFVNQKDFAVLLRRAYECKCIIVATCRSSNELESAKNKMISNSIYPENIFGTECVIELLEISDEIGQEVAKAVGKNWDDVMFNHTIGSILMPLKEMERRFSECDWEKQKILEGIKILYNCGIYEGNQIFPLDWIKRACTLDKFAPDDNRWDKWIGELAALDFLKRDKDGVRLEEVYLTDIIKPQESIDMLPLLERMRTLFANVPDALFKIAYRAYEIGNIDLRKALFVNIAIRAYSETLEYWTKDKSPMDYAMTQNNLGIAYGNLAEVENPAANCRSAIEAFHKALEVYTKVAFPMQYANTQNNLGTAYHTLAKMENKAENCKKARQAYEEALKIFMAEEMPVIYERAKNNLERLSRFCGDQSGQ